MCVFIVVTTVAVTAINVTGTNLLINSSGDIKITDYGLSKELHVCVTNACVHSSTSILTIGYCYQ